MQIIFLHKNALIFLLYLSLVFRLFFNFNCRSKMKSLMQLLGMPYLPHCFQIMVCFILCTHITALPQIRFCIIFVLSYVFYLYHHLYNLFIFFLRVLLIVSMKVTGYVIMCVCIVRARFFIFIVCSYVCFLNHSYPVIHLYIYIYI